jgi:hypothetical protein
MRPEAGTYPDYYDNYIPLVPEGDIISALLKEEKETSGFFQAIPAEHAGYAYAEGKWTIAQVLNHCIDTERIFSYRALRFARKDPLQPLPFDQDSYVTHSESECRTLSELLEEFRTVRAATISLFRSFSNDALLRTGNTAAGPATVLAIGYTICGHNRHHARIVSERYLKK